MINTVPFLTAVSREVRAIRRLVEQVELPTALDRLKRLEVEVMPCDPEDYATPIYAYDAAGNPVAYTTVLGWLAENDPLTLMTMSDPVRDTVGMGQRLAAITRRAGRPVLRVPACRAIATRYPAIETVGAYPTDVVEAFFTSAADQLAA